MEIEGIHLSITMNIGELRGLIRQGVAGFTWLELGSQLSQVRPMQVEPFSLKDLGHKSYD